MAAGAAIAGTVVVALAIRCRLGFGFSLVFVPLASLVGSFADAFRTAVLLEVIIGGILAWRLRGALRPLDALALKGFGLLGVVGGALARTVIPLRLAVGAAMSAVVLTGATWLVRPKRRWRRGGRKLAIAGVASGILNSWSSLSGPPVVLYYLATEDTDDGVRGALTGYFVLLYVVTTITLIATGAFRTYTKWSWLTLGVAIIVIGFRPIDRLGGRIPLDLTRASLVLMMITAAFVGLRAALG